jgi:zinc transporter 1/2/3
MGLRISSVFVVFIASLLGVMLPLVASRVKWVNLPSWVYFFARYFGSGVIVATAFIHLLFEANENLSSPCLPDAFRDFPYAYGIALIGIFGTFLIELVTKFKIAEKARKAGVKAPVHTHGPNALAVEGNTVELCKRKPHNPDQASLNPVNQTDLEITSAVESTSGAPKDGSASDKQSFKQPAVLTTSLATSSVTDHKLVVQISNICLLEFGIVFHSIFVGLTVAVSGAEFKTLYPVIVFHQMFEGLGLGARLDSTPWSPQNEWVAWLFAIMFSITTPLGIAIGLGIRTSFELNSPRALITNGVFDAISAGILIYTSLVELMGAEFLHSEEFEHASLKTVLGAYTWMALGAILMALIGAWA